MLIVLVVFVLFANGKKTFSFFIFFNNLFLFYLISGIFFFKTQALKVNEITYKTRSRRMGIGERFDSFIIEIIFGIKKPILELKSTKKKNNFYTNKNQKMGMFI